jgi:hypothetical protein
MLLPCCAAAASVGRQNGSQSANARRPLRSAVMIEAVLSSWQRYCGCNPEAWADTAMAVPAGVHDRDRGLRAGQHAHVGEWRIQAPRVHAAAATSCSPSKAPNTCQWSSSTQAASRSSSLALAWNALNAAASAGRGGGCVAVQGARPGPQVLRQGSRRRDPRHACAGRALQPLLQLRECPVRLRAVAGERPGPGAAARAQGQRAAAAACRPHPHRNHRCTPGAAGSSCSMRWPAQMRRQLASIRANHHP